MRKVLLAFLLFMLLYHIVHTFVIYGQGWMSVGVFSLTKEFLFLCMVLYSLWISRKHLYNSYRDYYWFLWMILMIFVIFLGVSGWNHVPRDSVMVGIKYDLRWLIILFGGLVLGVQDTRYTIQDTLLPRIVTGMRIVIIGGIVWQTGKLFVPEFFQRRGYGPVGDYILGSHPPIRYRTGPGGWMRFSGIFSGPNNLGYMMAAFFPVVFGSFLTSSGVQTGLLSKRNVVIAMVITTLATFSRAAIGAVFLELILLLRIYKPFWRKWIYGLLFFGLFCLLGLLATKTGSTLEHLSRFIEGIMVVQQFPWGLGLGMAGPSIHYHGIYLPENQYLQRAIDGGIIGFLCIMSFLFLLCHQFWKQRRSKNLAFLLSVGLGGLLAIGLFLHSLEDSMVNYSFFLLLGVSFGSKVHVKSKE